MQYRTVVKLIKAKNNSALVEYVFDGKLSRCYIPQAEFGGHVLNSVLQQGIPYGFAFEELDIKFDSAKLADELHQVGIWTVDDLLKNPKGLASALNQTLSEITANILRINKR